VIFTIPAVTLPAEVPIVVGAGGQGGANLLDGDPLYKNVGASGGMTFFGDNVVTSRLVAWGGGGAQSFPGRANASMFQGSSGGMWGYTAGGEGGNSGETEAIFPQAQRGPGCQGGGGGGSVASADAVAGKGGYGATSTIFLLDAAWGGLDLDGPDPTQINGENGTSVPVGYPAPGVAGAGGGASLTGAGGNGGHAGLYGAGGGGGGAVLTGDRTPGAGGNGAPGIVVVTSYF
jgi:hypothetical protein